MLISHHKTMLSKLLAQEDIYVHCDPKAKTASFNIKDRVLILPDWQGISESLLDMLIVHEVGHALNTPANGWIKDAENIAKKLNLNAKNAANKIRGFLNVVEDARIDKLQKRRYPGTKRDYVAGLIELHARDFFGFNKSKKPLQDYAFIDRMNIYFKGGYNMGIQFNPIEKEFMDRAEVLEDWKDVVSLTHDIYKYSLDNNESNDIEPIKITQDQLKEMMENSEPSDGDSDGPPIEIEVEQECDGEESPSESGGEPSDAKSNPKPTDESKNKPAQTKPEDKTLPESETADSLDAFSSEQAKTTGQQKVYVNLPTYYLDKIVDDYPVVLKSAKQVLKFIKDPYKDVMEFKNSELSTISFLVKEFEMRKAADAYARNSTAKTGVLNTNKLHSYMYNEDIFKRNTVVTDGKNHGFIMLIDWSESMAENLLETIKQLITLSLFYRRVNVPFEVYLFRSPNGSTVKQFSDTVGTRVHFENFKMRNILSSRMKEFEFNTMISYIWNIGKNRSTYGSEDPLSRTPLNQSLYVMEEIVRNFQKRTKVQVTNVITLTDGVSNCDYISAQNYKAVIIEDKKTRTQYSGDMTKILLEMLKNNTGVNLIGFYICNYFPEDSNPTWKNEGFVESKSMGYDSHYHINRNTLKTEDIGIDDINTIGKEIEGLTTKIINTMGKKLVSRVLLRKFIGGIIK